MQPISTDQRCSSQTLFRAKLYRNWLRIKGKDGQNIGVFRQLAWSKSQWSICELRERMAKKGYKHVEDIFWLMVTCWRELCRNLAEYTVCYMCLSVGLPTKDSIQNINSSWLIWCWESIRWCWTVSCVWLLRIQWSIVFKPRFKYNYKSLIRWPLMNTSVG